MGWYRIGDGKDQAIAHIHFGRKVGVASCRAPRLVDDKPDWGALCGRMSVALCDGPGGRDLAGKALTCDMPICEHHRTKGGTNIDYCPRHQQLAEKPLFREGSN